MGYFQQFQVVFTFLGGIALAVGGYLFRARVLELIQDRASRQDMGELVKRVEGLEDRCHSMEVALQHLPKAEDIKALTLGIADLRGEVHVVGANFASVEKALATLTRRVELIDESLTRRTR